MESLGNFESELRTLADIEVKFQMLLSKEQAATMDAEPKGAEFPEAPGQDSFTIPF